MDKYQLDLINNIKYYRTKNNISQAQFAEYCNVSTGTIGNIECGLAKPSFDLIIKMATILGIQPSCLFANTSDSQPINNVDLINEHKLLQEIYEKLSDFYKSDKH